ncbi:hypothetical protein B0G84_2310 [Paraburkholderia sp. BL8N3]|nr:hypothetical protein [Paraburkholderia sp. BL8N3]TCK43962.1 hypothetical protein B0G84_2310 [Paraburkholderia sp. BL8N3]
MKPKTFIEQAEREAKLVDGLLLARYTLVIHHGKLCTAERETWKMDFRAELSRIDSALQMAGIDTTQPLHPPFRYDEDEDE